MKAPEQDSHSPSWLVPVLLIQIALAFFAPPIAWGSKTLFLSDFWIFGWLPFALVAVYLRLGHPERRRLLGLSLVSSLITLIVYAHGALRPSLALPLSRYVNAPPSDLFAAGKELVVGLRFLSWFLAAVIVGIARPPTQLLCRMLALSVALATVSLLLAKLSPSMASLFGQIYLYDPLGAPDWSYRAFGVFRSPVEGSITLGLALGLLAMGTWATLPVRIVVLLCTLIGIYLTQTVTSLAAMAVTLAIFGACQSWRSWKAMTIVTLICAATGLYLTYNSSPFLAAKVGNFLYRFGPWGVFVNAAVSRGHLLLLGLGFTSFFVDNFYIFLLNRGGLLLLGTLVTFVGLQLRKKWPDWSTESKAAAVFLLVSGLTVDNFVIRPLVAIFIAVAMPLFSRGPSPTYLRIPTSPPGERP